MKWELKIASFILFSLEIQLFIVTLHFLTTATFSPRTKFINLAKKDVRAISK